MLLDSPKKIKGKLKGDNIPQKVVNNEPEKKQITKIDGDLYVTGKIYSMFAQGGETKWEEQIKEYLHQNGDITEIGGKLEVDGNALFNTLLEIGESAIVGNHLFTYLANHLELQPKLNEVVLTKNLNDVYESTEIFTSKLHLVLEVDTETTHSSINFDLNPYDSVESLAYARANFGGELYDVYAYLDNQGHIVFNPDNATGITRVKAYIVAYK